MTETPEESDQLPEEAPPDIPDDAFVHWLRRGLDAGLVEVNTPKALLHVLPEGVFLVSPRIFKAFDPTGWLKAQKHFQRLKINRRTACGENVFTCRVAGPRNESLLRGFVVDRQAPGFADLALPPPNPHLTLLSGGVPRTT